jgi:hypothetical protein
LNIFDWFRSRKLAKLEKELFDIEWSLPPATHRFDESQMVMFWRQNQIDLIKSKIEKLKTSITK